MEELLKFMRWLKGSYSVRTTSRDNIYTVYWVEMNTGKLYNDKELLEYYKEVQASGPKDPEK